MKIDTLKNLLEIDKRQELYEQLLNQFKRFEKLPFVSYKTLDTSEGLIPSLKISNHQKDDLKFVKIFIGAQHNEYNGLFGILEFFQKLDADLIDINEILLKNQMLLFFPLMNPYGFLNPSRNNKSGYYLKNGTNLNRYWRRTFVPEYQNTQDDLSDYPIPPHSEAIKKVIKNIWKNENISIYFMDFHETSLLYRFPKELSLHLNTQSFTYKFDHWLKEAIIKNIITLYNLPFHRKPLFQKCSLNADHSHLQLSIKQIEIIHEKLLEFVVKNKEKLPFYFCYSNKSKEFCERLATKVCDNFKKKGILWDTTFPAVSHYHDHGCLVMMSDATNRKKVYALELESQKHFFDIFDEIKKSKTGANYFQDKLKLINFSLDLATETIKVMVKLF